MSSFLSHIMVLKMQMVISIKFLVTMIDEHCCVFNIADECQSICNSNPTKATAMLLLRVDVLKMVTTNDADDHMVIWL